MGRAMKPARPNDPTWCFWCGWPGAEVELGPPVRVCNDECAAELEAFVEAEELLGKGAAAPRQGNKAAPPDYPATEH